jgi:dolichyl-phosphate-mannose-protein mannosyltransferase
MANRHHKLYIIVIIIASVVTHFLFFGHPKETVFDEVHFGKFISGYFTHQYFFDIHPPLGKLIISGMGYVTGFKPGFSFAEIGEKFSGNSFEWLRLLPIIAGTLLPLVIYLLALELGLSGIASFTAGLLLVFENATLVQSRFILLDAFLLLFGFAALLFYLRYEKNGRLNNLFLSGALAVLSVSVKWTGLTFLVIILVLSFIKWLKSATKVRDFLIHASALLVVPLIIYFSIFVIHFQLLPKSGPGDAFMTPEFRKTLIGSSDYGNANFKPLNLFQKFIELNKEMYTANATLTAGHPYSSKWYSWPFMIRPIYYWYEAPLAGSTASSRIYFLGNPIVWWASTVAMLYLLLGLGKPILKFIRKQPADLKRIELILAGAYIFNLLPFIGIKRAMFLYHYMIGLIFAILALVYLIDGSEKRNKIFAVLILASIAAFVFFSPLSYGLPLTDKAYNLRNWLKTWL